MDDIFSPEDLDDDILGEILGTGKRTKKTQARDTALSSARPVSEDGAEAGSRPETGVSMDIPESASPEKRKSEELGIGFVPSFFDAKPRQKRSATPGHSILE